MEKLIKLLDTLTDEQKQLLKDTIKFWFWGDGDQEFLIDGKIETRGMYGYCTNEAKNAGHFSGRKISAMFRSMYKKIIGEFFSHCSDWWGDGSGDMLFIREDVVDFMEDWAKK